MPEDTQGRHVIWHRTDVTRADRERQAGHRGMCLWLTGISGSGKSTIATAVERRLHEEGYRTYLLDGDNLRHALNADLGFSEEDRHENVRRVAHVAKLFVDAGVVVLCALISPFREDRARARALFDAGSFVEVHVHCPVDVCAQRDPKGLYQKVQQGLIQNFTGVSAPYEPPEQPEVRVNTDELSVEQCVNQILQYVRPRLCLDGDKVTV
ncbi:MAG: adenylyl-sulfate kinase [Alicyclobacillaceae bacterium]|nr:adenylyl-sulfate kinase [Alicyclobacillaceae bacterium]